MEIFLATALVVLFAAAILMGAPLFAIIGGGALVLFSLVADQSLVVPIIC